MLESSAMASYKTPEGHKRHSGDVIRNLRELFGGVLPIDIIRSVALQCEFDVEKSSNLLLEMSNTGGNKTVQNPSNTNSKPTGVSKKSNDIERVVKNIRQGYKILVILRGIPGSGKSYLARTLTELTLGPGNNYSHHILSTDDFFISNRSGYTFDPRRLQDAHGWNQNRAFEAMSRGLSPVIIDNTNTELWEMRPYAAIATDYGYVIEIIEPDTWWCFNEKELARRNKHNVPKAKIKDMLDRYQKNVTPLKLLSAYSLQYTLKKPPQYRDSPPIRQNFQTSVPKSKSASNFEVVNLMDFNEEASNGLVKSPTSWSCKVDEILMCRENESQSDVLQPKKMDLENAWGVDTNVFRSWDFVTPLDSDWELEPVHSEQPEVKAEVRDGESAIDPFDFKYASGECDNMPSNYKIRCVKERDINENCPKRSYGVPKKIMVDKSCYVEGVDSQDVHKQMHDLRDLFPKIPRSYLKEIYDKCDKNFNWTVDVLLEDNSYVTMDVTEDENEVVEPPGVPPDNNEDNIMHTESSNINKGKNKMPSEEALQLKRCIEEKIDYNKEHYSEHVFKVKQNRFGGPDPQPSTSSAISEQYTSSDDDESSTDDPKNMIEFNLGETFVEQLETLFGGEQMAFPKGFQPVVQIPTSLARQIYSFYVESLCQQMDAQNHILDRLIQEDEDFARKLQHEEERQNGGQEPTPNLAEIMADQRSANQAQRFYAEEWNNLNADTLAAKLTKQKLFDSFPGIPRDSLLEILHAYSNDYNKTVEDLINSVGAENLNGSKETINEPPLSESTLKELKDAENGTIYEDVDETKPAVYYREQANKHLKRREELYDRARIYFQRGMTEVAQFYSQLATKETQFYDKANHLAATTFTEEHSKRLQKFDTLDLHYLFVKEAIPTLDIFIDRNINLLKGGPRRGQDLFVITGRGKNSEGGICKIKPAVISRLRKRKIGFVQLNPGLLKIRVLALSLMTSDLPQ